MEDQIREVNEIVNRHLENDCDNLGPEQTLKIVVEAVNGQSLETILSSARKEAAHGANMDVSFVLEIVFKAATFINTCLIIYKELEKRFGRKPTISEITIKAKALPE